MTSTAPRRIARLEVTLDVPPEVSDRVDPAARAELEKAARGCPVCRSLLDAIEIPIEFRWRT